MKNVNYDVDRLAEVRAEIKKLEAEEEAIRLRLILQNPFSSNDQVLHGINYVAVISRKSRMKFDTEAAVAWFGEAKMARFFKMSKFTYVKVRRIGQS